MRQRLEVRGVHATVRPRQRSPTAGPTANTAKGERRTPRRIERERRGDAVLQDPPGERHRSGLPTAVRCCQSRHVPLDPRIGHGRSGDGDHRRVEVEAGDGALAPDACSSETGDACAAGDVEHTVAGAEIGDLLLRAHLADAPAAERGWLAALHDPVLAPAAIHRAPDRRWTLTDLATEATASRSLLGARFREVLGRSPMRYLTEWRMHVAQDLLSTTGQSVATISRTRRLRLRRSVQPSIQANPRPLTGALAHAPPVGLVGRARARQIDG